MRLVGAKHTASFRSGRVVVRHARLGYTPKSETRVAKPMTSYQSHKLSDVTKNQKNLLGIHN